jgi:hypothetical protein
VAISVIATATANGGSGGSGSASITHGLTIAANDVLIAVFNEYPGGAIASTGDYQFTEDYARETDANGLGQCIYSRVAGASEPSAYTWSMPTWTAYWICLLQLRGVDTSSIWDVAPSVDTFGTVWGTTCTAPSMTIATAGALGLLIGQGTKVLSGATDDYADDIGLDTSPISRVWRRTWSSTGATGTTDCTLAATGAGRLHQVAVKPSVLVAKPHYYYAQL